ncbi:uncharacterized protein AB675_7605 [Cyphellophora attinorum]|uniref:Uncharacterized protein n=1 Tax=Cyphellophora attinorum TaxID=1664694 RepID=A0A0N0NMK7_9EURO|nr:uncharacterized protein AB675_7605 [Phialophora attinorum]KPI40319.1 hypothetical protein AB675_7605 [Phialophora attinorum]
MSHPPKKRSGGGRWKPYTRDPRLDAQASEPPRPQSSKKPSTRGVPVERALIPTQPQQQHITTLLQPYVNPQRSETPAKITDVEYLASYNWLSHGKRTIIVPGCPPRWTPPVEAVRLSKDYGMRYHDKNASQYPSFPLEPSVRAIFALYPTFDSQSIDLFACSNTIRNLGSFVNQAEKNFRFYAEKIGSTLFLMHVENGGPMDIIKDVVGYGHNFAEAYTTWDEGCKGSETHQRLIAYNLGGLRCVVRYEADGYLPEKLDEGHPLKHVAEFGSKEEATDSIKAEPGTSIKEEAMNSIKEEPMDYIKEEPMEPALEVQLQVTRFSIPQSAVFDLKTRQVTTPNPIRESQVHSRAWATQSPNFILAHYTRDHSDKRHVKGRFSNDSTVVHDVSSDIKEWEADNEVAIRGLIQVIKKLDEITESREEKRVEVRREGLGDLQIWTAAIQSHADAEEGVLPPSVISAWKGEPEAREAVLREMA